MISIFADKTTLILRKMLKDQGKQWVIQDFTKTRDSLFGVGQGRVQKVLDEMQRLGYIERVKRGPKSYAILTNPQRLLEDWVSANRFEFNEVYSYYSPDKNILKKIKGYFKGKNNRYALTLHCAANLLTFFIKTEDVYFYLNSNDIKRDSLDIRQKLDLKQLIRGGNVHIIKPYYKHSVFFNAQKIEGYTVVSDLQLYLDMYNFQPRGREHAEYLKKLIEQKGVCLA